MGTVGTLSTVADPLLSGEHCRVIFTASCSYYCLGPEGVTGGQADMTASSHKPNFLLQ